MTICIWQFPCTFCCIDFSSFFLKMSKKACKYHKLQSSAKKFPQIRFMGIFNMLFVIPFCIKWHQKTFDINFFRVQPFSYQPIAPYLSDLLSRHQPTRSLRSADAHLLVVPRSNLCSQGDRAFSHAAPRLWNNLPLAMRAIDSQDIFTKQFKTILFRRAFSL